MTRWRQPIDALTSTPPRTILLIGFPAERWAEVTTTEFAALDAAVRGGSRLVFALHATRFGDSAKKKKTVGPSARGEVHDEEKNPPEKSPERAAPQHRDREDDAATQKKNGPVFVDLAKLWGVELKQRSLLGPARRAFAAEARLPDQLRWASDIYFKAAPEVPWATKYRRGIEPVMVELKHGRGSIVLLGDAYGLSNEALQRDRSTALLVWLAGPQARVEFVESHLGLTEEPGVAALARRYGLGGAFFMLFVLAGLFIWRRMALFVPPADEVNALALDYNQTAGLEALLRRAVRPAELIAMCTAEWRRTARAPDVARVETAVATLPKTVGPAIIYNAILHALRRR